MLKGFLKARRLPKVSNEMKCTDEKMAWNCQDKNCSSSVPMANVDHTISGYRTGTSTVDHLATTPRANVSFSFICRLHSYNFLIFQFFLNLFIFHCFSDCRHLCFGITYTAALHVWTMYITGVLHMCYRFMNYMCNSSQIPHICNTQVAHLSIFLSDSQ